MVRPLLAATDFSTASQAATAQETTILPGQRILAIRIGPDADAAADFLNGRNVRSPRILTIPPRAASAAACIASPRTASAGRR